MSQNYSPESAYGPDAFRRLLDGIAPSEGVSGPIGVPSGGLPSAEESPPTSKYNIPSELISWFDIGTLDDLAREKTEKYAMALESGFNGFRKEHGREPDPYETSVLVSDAVAKCTSRRRTSESL